jgi:hypothetical protein
MRLAIGLLVLLTQYMFEAKEIPGRIVNYPAASGRGIRIKKEQVARLCVT